MICAWLVVAISVTQVCLKIKPKYSSSTPTWPKKSETNTATFVQIHSQESEPLHFLSLP